MKASVNERYGSPDVLAIHDIRTPQPANGEIQVRVHATTVGRTDTCGLRTHPFFVRLITGLLRPKRKILGLDFAGTVESVGADVTRFARGDRVFGLTPSGHGAHAEVVCLPEDGPVARMPEGRRVVFPNPRADRALVEFIRDRIEADDLQAVVDRRYPLEDIADAYRYVETQRKTGIVVIDVASGTSK